MAEMTVNPLSQIAAAQRSNSNANSSNPASALNAAPENGSFAQELKTRTQTPEAPKPTPAAAPKPAQQEPRKTSEQPGQADQAQQSAQATPGGESGNTTTAGQTTSTEAAALPGDPQQLLQTLVKDAGASKDDEDKDTLTASDATPQLIATPFLPANAAPAANTAAVDAGDRKLASLAAEPSKGTTDLKDLLAQAGSVGDGKALAAAAVSESGGKTAGPSSEAAQPTPAFAAELEQARQSVASAAHQNAAQSPMATAQHVVHTPVGIPGWADEVGQRITWAAQNDNGRAELVLTPAHLGRLEVSINVNGDQATANFVTGSSAAREALEESLPRLREVLSQAGIQLGQANVSTGHGHQAQSDGRGTQGAFAGSQARGTRSDLPLPNTHSAIMRSGNGLVDTFA